MEKFKVIKTPRAKSKSKFGVEMDDDLQLWIRQVAHANDMPIIDVVHQIVEFAKRNYSRSKK